MNKSIKNFDYLIFIAMLYVAVDLSSMAFAYKIIEIGTLTAAASSLIFPVTYSIMDIIAEVYGYQIAKKIIWYSFMCNFIFTILAFFISHIPSTSHLQTIAYIEVLGALPRVFIAQMTGVLLGAFINIHLISKWKVITNGRYFWLRSIGSSTIGEAVMLIISVLISLGGILSFSTLFHLIIFTYLYKVIFAIIAAPFVSVIAVILKNKTGLARGSVKFNPFSGIQNKQDFSPNFQKS